MHIDHKQLKAARAQTLIDYRTVLAGALAGQGLSAAAAAQVHYDVTRKIDNSVQEAIATLMQARPGWRAAAAVLGGSFHPGVADLVDANGF